MPVKQLLRAVKTSLKSTPERTQYQRRLRKSAGEIENTRLKDGFLYILILVHVDKFGGLDLMT